MRCTDLTIGEIVRSQRASRGLTQQQLKRLANIGLTTIWKIEKDKVLPSMSSGCRIADAFDIDIEAFTNILIGLKIKAYVAKYYELFDIHRKEKSEFDGEARIYFDQHNEDNRIYLFLPRTGGWLRYKRLQAKKTVRKISEETGIDEKNVSRMENGKKSISFKSIFLLSKCLDFEPTELLHIMVMEKTQTRVKLAREYVANYIKGKT